jgi:hypothetical protein
LPVDTPALWHALVVTTNSIAILNEFVKSELGITCRLDVRRDDGDRRWGIVRNRNQPSAVGKAEAHPIKRVGRKLSLASNKMLQMMPAQMRDSQ